MPTDRQAAATAAKDTGNEHEALKAYREDTEREDASEDTDDLLAAVAGAISQAEREAAMEQPEITEGDGGDDAREAEGGPARSNGTERQAEARKRAADFLQGMLRPGGEQNSDGGAGCYARRPGKEPALGASQMDEEATPPQHPDQQ